MSEDQLQQSIIIYFKNEYQRHGKGFIFSVPNGGSRNPIEAKKLKATGATAGVSDLIVMLESGKILFVELKTEKGVQSEAQKEFEQRITALGFNYQLIRNIKEFEELCLKKDQKTTQQHQLKI